MDFFDRLHRLLDRVRDSYAPWEVALEIIIIWAVVFLVVRFVQGTRAAGAIKALLLLLVVSTLLVRIVGQRDAFQRLTFLYSEFLTLLAITLIVIFQPELRRGLIRLGETPILRRASSSIGTADAIADACKFLSKARFGAIIAVERDIPLRGLIEGGTEIGGRVSARLLQTIFFPGSALHDLAVIVQGDQIVAAGVQLPLADPDDMPDSGLGSRHRAAVGLSKECDAVVVVVSEETGTVSIAERGRLSRLPSQGDLAEELRRRLRARPAAPGDAASPEGAEDGSDGAERAGVEEEPTWSDSVSLSEPPLARGGVKDERSR